MSQSVAKKEKPKVELSIYQKSLDSRKKHQAELALVKVDLQVRDADHARSPEVIDYCVKFLSKGGTWDVLRRKLGVGAANSDNRWRVIRGQVCETFIPKSEEEALLAQANTREFLLQKLEGFVEEVESTISNLPDGEEGLKALPAMMKLKLETLKAFFDENERSFKAYTELKKIKTLEKKNQGGSIIINNNYHMNRPGQNAKDVTNTLDTASKLLKVEGKSGS